MTIRIVFKAVNLKVVFFSLHFILFTCTCMLYLLFMVELITAELKLYQLKTSYSNQVTKPAKTTSVYKL